MRLVLLLLTVVTCAACARPREYELRGQVLDVNAGRREITVKHEDIPGFMPAMTMAFAVRDERLMRGREAGELIRATLVVGERGAHLTRIERAGFAPVKEPLPPGAVDILQPGDEVPDATLVDQAGRARRLSDWRGQALAVTFTYTRCPLPNFCPLMDRQFAEMQRAIAGDPSLRGRAHLVSVSIDPAHDTPQVLHAHATRMGADPAHWTFVTAAAADLAALAGRFGVSILREGTAEEIVHNLRTGIIDRDGRVVTIVSGNEWTPPDLVAHLRQAVGR